MSVIKPLTISKFSNPYYHGFKHSRKMPDTKFKYPRNYQEIPIQELIKHPKAILTAPTGSGKTYMSLISALVKKTTNQVGKVLITVPQLQIGNNWSQIVDFGLKPGQHFPSFVPQNIADDSEEKIKKINYLAIRAKSPSR